jgi:hypothetical protein
LPYFRLGASDHYLIVRLDLNEKSDLSSNRRGIALLRQQDRGDSQQKSTTGCQSSDQEAAPALIHLNLAS